MSRLLATAVFDVPNLMLHYIFINFSNILVVYLAGKLYRSYHFIDNRRIFVIQKPWLDNF